jgi:predicted transcriptional regulator
MSPEKKPKLSQKEIDAIMDAADAKAGATDDALYKELHGNGSKTSKTALPIRVPKSTESSLSPEELEKLKKENAERRRKYYNLREEERHMLDRFDKARYTGEYFANTHKVPVCHKLMGDWWEVADYGFLYAPRGLGKSYFILALCHALSTGTSIAGWNIGAPVKITYVDGEMSQQDLQDRLRDLRLANKDLHVINHDVFFRENGTIFCLSDEVSQNALLQDCYNHNSKVLVLDNLSSLFRGVEENSADDWEVILSWLLKCRRYGISVVLIHHSGKDGSQRGTSRREDAAAWSIKLDAVGREDIVEGEVKFQAIFMKVRHCGFPVTTEWTLKFPSEETPNAPITISVEEKSMEQAVLDLIQTGVDNNKDIADHLGLSAATITKLFQRLEKKGLAFKQGQAYRAGKAEKERKPGTVEVNAPPVEDAVLATVKSPDKPMTFVEICESLKTVADWTDKTVEHVINRLVKSGELMSKEIPNPKTGKGQKKTRLAYYVP